MNPQSSFAISRRSALKSLLASGLGGLLPSRVFGRSKTNDGIKQVLDYLETLRRADGGYAWHGQMVSHLAPTLYAIGCFHALNRTPPRKSELIDFTWKHHPQSVWPLSERRFIFDYQHIQALSWLGEDVTTLREKIAELKEPRGYNKRYEKQGNPFFQAEIKHFKSRELVGLPRPSKVFINFLDARRRDNGSYNTTPASDGGDGNILNTWWGLEALHSLGRSNENKDSLIQWLQTCQLSNGGFSHQPYPQMAGLDDVSYTWAALRALQLLGVGPIDEQACIRYLHSLANGDGGFADRPGWLSNPMATYYAIDALSCLAEIDLDKIQRRPSPPRKSLPSGLSVYSIQIESHGRGSPIETVALAKALRIHLWGSKNASPGWRKKVAELAAADQVPVTFFLADEEYGSWVDVPGMGTFSHIADLMSPSDADIGESLAKAGPVSWPEFRERRVKPLREGKGRLNWQFGQHEDAIRLFLDDSLMRPGYSAISTFHFGNIDFTTSEPFLHRWRGQLPFIALQDAHGNEPWWFSDQTEGMRTLFLGTEPTWDSWLKAIDHNWVAAVRHDYRTQDQTWIHSGSDEVTEYIVKRELDWRWWNNPDIARPLVSLVAVRPEDEFEAGRPEQGINLRIRVARRNTNHGLLKEALAQFESLTLNGKQVFPEQVSVPASRDPNSLEDQYFLYPLPFKPGEYTATAAVMDLTGNNRIVETIRVTLP
ncbi:MAG: hypothetical protein ACI92G_003719 [Candidatus Pelagisphaera sp.]|jgi:hypothetical protein